MEENKVIISLDKFIEMRDKLKDLEALNNTIIEYILSYAELENGKLNIDYNIKYSNFLTKLAKDKYPEKYEKRLKELQEEK